MGSSSGSRAGIVPLALIGVLAGIFSGLFGIGGGTLIVPALALWLSFPQRLAAGTSLAAILPMAVVGATSYGVQGNIDWTAAALLAFGVIFGAQLGSYLLAKAPVAFLQWAFLGFLAVVIVSLWVVVPQRDNVISMSVGVGALLLLTGFIVGIFSSLLGVGGGVVLVPVLILFFGTSDLIAKGSSLAMMIPGAISGTIGNRRRKNVNLRAAAIIGIAGSVTAPFGALLAAWIDPFIGNILFSVYLAFIAAQLLWRKIKRRK
ncbi:hypothetical protein FB472_2621 [Rhodoglobus vestalii]|uniref:Probable membrane transporter protein n=1 Tax=Rhodoglobus vestalii TaxID=193384 RepID=A0A8H2PUW1_9MICO|nr:sulfite exporter TauE/SafE family protein [Rhodoglobus vestalii]TQO20961.1 hypothetical protein FB472_2621 [Rhodoglobus vestalii]